MKEIQLKVLTDFPGRHSDERKLQRMLDGHYGEAIAEPVVASRGEILLNTLEFMKHYNLPVQAHEDIHRLINSLFHKEVIPESKYKIDQLLCSSTKTIFVFFCEKCFDNLGSLNHNIVRVKACQNCGHENQISDLTKPPFFIIVNFTDQLQLLLNEQDEDNQPISPNHITGHGDCLIYMMAKCIKTLQPLLILVRVSLTFHSLFVLMVFRYLKVKIHPFGQCLAW